MQPEPLYKVGQRFWNDMGHTTYYEITEIAHYKHNEYHYWARSSTTREIFCCAFPEHIITNALKYHGPVECETKVEGPKPCTCERYLLFTQGCQCGGV